MHTRHTPRYIILALLAALTLVLAACGSDSDGDASGGSDNGSEGETGGDAGENGAGENDGDAGGNGGGDCAGTRATGTYPGGDFSATSALAVPFDGGLAWTAFLADFDLDPDDLASALSSTTGGRAIPDGFVPGGSVLFSVALTTPVPIEEPGPIEPGTVDAWASGVEGLAFVVVAAAGEETFGTLFGADGTVTVTSVGDRLCGEIDYTDGEKSLTGTFEAPAIDIDM
jgi:hypothetical protein